MKNEYDVLIIGGGAAGFFSAINLSINRPELKIAILERSKEVLNKVRISGGGRCNVTHAEFIPKELSKKYPRGKKELLGPFHTFMTGDTIAWFEERGVSLKIEEDGRMFPDTDTSETIINCFLKEVDSRNVEVLKNHSVKDFGYDTTFTKVPSSENVTYYIDTSKGIFKCKHLVITTGSSPKMWNVLKKLGHTITPDVPSLFTFNIKDKRIEGLMGLATEVSVKVIGSSLKSEGPLLITHWGMSGPAILKLSAWGARVLADLNYQFELQVNWRQFYTADETLDELLELKNTYSKQSLYTYAQLELPKRLWQRMLQTVDITKEIKWANVTKKQLRLLAMALTESRFKVNGKSTFKEEFVTAGGVDLKEIQFKTFESKMCSNLYLAGEVLNIDAITGGFNFQNAWTGGYIIAQSISERDKSLS